MVACSGANFVSRCYSRKLISIVWVPTKKERRMKRTIILTTVLLLASPLAMAYQVTGPVEEVTATKIVVQKGKEKWELARDANTKVQGEVKKGDKVTVEYKMTATSIEVKGGKGAEKGKAKGKK
jgi:hypothetical protein